MKKFIIIFLIITSYLIAQPYQMLNPNAGYVRQFPTLVSNDTIDFGTVNSYTTADIEWINNDWIYGYSISVNSTVGYVPFGLVSNSGTMANKGGTATIVMSLAPTQDTTYYTPVIFYALNSLGVKVDTFNLTLKAVVSGLGDSTPVIIEQPIATTIDEGADGILFLNAVASDLGYQWWYQKTAGGTSYEVPDNSVFDGVTNDTLFINNAPDSIDGYIFTCEVKNLDCYPTYPCWVNSNEVVLTVTPSAGGSYEYDYIVDTRIGVGDFYTIAQLNAASIPSGSVVGFQGGQTFTGAILDCKSGVTYTTYGSGIATIGDSLTTSFTHSVQIDNKTDVTIDELKIYGTNSSASYSTLNQYANAATGIIVTSSLFYAADTASMTNKNIVIKNCKIIGGHNSTVNQKGQGISVPAGIKGLTIDNNEISYFAEAIYINNPYQVNIKNNILHDIYWAEPRRNLYNSGLRGAEAIELYGEYANSSTAWNTNYTVRISDNEIYNFETSAMVTTTISKVIIERNEVHDNLDPTIYHGGIDHAHGLGKLDDYSFGVTRDFPGSIGTIVRWNKIYNIDRGTTSLQYSAHDGFRFKYGGTDYETDGSVYLWKYYSIDPGYSPYSVGAVIDGSGYDMQIYGNLIYDCDRRAIIRTQKSSATDMTANTTYKNEIYNNTFWNVAYDPALTDYGYNGGSIVGIVEKMPPTYVRNNIFYMTGDKGAALYIQYGKLYEGNNIFFVNSNVSTGGAGNANFNEPPDAIYVSSGATRTVLGTASTFGVSLGSASNYFVDYSNKDFRLKSGSPAINTGADLGNDRQGITKISGKDYVSGTIDVGAYEYGSTNP